MAGVKALGVVAALLLIGGGVMAATEVTAGFAVSGAVSMQGSPTLAVDTNTGRFLVAWTDNRNRAAGLDIYGRILGPDGAPVSPDFPVAEAGRGQAFAALAFDRNSSRFLVVWTDWRDARTVDSDIYGRFVGTDGRPDGEAFPIARERVSQKFPAVAFDAAGERFLVVWTEKRSRGADRIRGRLLGSDGSVVGPAFTLADRGGDQLRPSVVFDPNRGRFLVVWWDSDDAATSATFVDAKTAEIAPSLKLSGEHDPQPAPLYAIAHSPRDDLYLVAWTSKDVPAERGSDIHAVLVEGATASPKSPAFPVATGAGSQQAATVAYDSGRGRFLVVWLERRRSKDADATEMRVHGRFVSARGDLSDAFSISDPPAPGTRRSPVVAFNPVSNSFLILWEDGRGGSGPDRRIYGRVR